MSTIWPPGLPPASADPFGTAARPHWSFGSVLASTIVILIGIAIGGFIGIFIGLVNGWIEIGC